MTDDNVKELRDMIDNAISSAPSTAYYNKCESLSDTKFNWLRMVHPTSMDDWFSLPDKVQEDYAMWYVSMVAINNGIRWQDACNNLVLIQHKLTEESCGITSFQYEENSNDRDVLNSIKKHMDDINSLTMLQLSYIIGSSGFDPADKKASERLKTMGVLRELTIEDNAELDHYENEFIIPQASFYAKMLFNIKIDEDNEEFNGMTYLLSNFLKLENEDSIPRFIRFKNAISKSKQLGLDGDLGYDWLINMANDNRNYMTPLDDKNFTEKINQWIDRVEAV